MLLVAGRQKTTRTTPQPERLGMKATCDLSVESGSNTKRNEFIGGALSAQQKLSQ